MFGSIRSILLFVRMSQIKDSLGRFDVDSSVNLLPLSDSILSEDNLPKTSGNVLNSFSLRKRISRVCNASIASGKEELAKERMITMA